MIGIFTRELRENLKWALLVFAALLVMIVRDLREPEPMILFQLAQHYTLWMAPIAGILLGVVQLVFETRPDNWSFVVHRPVSRGRIFAAKCAAGLLLLYAALTLPCLVAGIWASRPGNLGVPYQGRMMLPMLADVLNAGSYYFAGMVLTLRRARWFGTRLLPAGLALASSFLITMFIAQFWLSVLVILCVQLIGALAAWGVFASNGASDDSWITRLALGAIIYPGALAVGIGLLGFSQAFISGGRWQYYQVDRHGDAVVVTQTIEHGERGWSFTDPAGNPLRQYEGMDLDDPANRDQFVSFNGHLVDPRSIPWPLDLMYTNAGYRFPNPGLEALRGGALPGVRLRFLAIYDIPQHLIELFDPVSRVQIGAIGPDGFSPAPTLPDRRFDGIPLNLSVQPRSRVLAFESIVYRLELDQRRVLPVFVAVADDPVFSAVEVGQGTNAKILVATHARLHVLSVDGQSSYSVPWEQDPNSCNFDVAQLPSNHHLLVRAFTNPGIAPPRTRMFEYSADGALVRRSDLPRLGSLGSSKKVESMAFGAIFPVAARMICPAWILDDLFDLRMEEFQMSFALVLWISAALCATATVLIGIRCGFGLWKTLGWSVLNLLLGPAGLVVMLGVNDWPSREKCAHCHRMRFVGRRDCPRCGAALAPAPRDGREIFEPADAFSSDEALQAVG